VGGRIGAWPGRREIRERVRQHQDAARVRGEAELGETGRGLKAGEADAGPIEQAQDAALERPPMRLLKIVVDQEAEPGAQRPDQGPDEQQDRRHELAHQDQVVIGPAPDPGREPQMSAEQDERLQRALEPAGGEAPAHRDRQDDDPGTGEGGSLLQRLQRAVGIVVRALRRGEATSPGRRRAGTRAHRHIGPCRRRPGASAPAPSPRRVRSCRRARSCRAPWCGFRAARSRAARPGDHSIRERCNLE
jgi:hypothetical protein